MPFGHCVKHHNFTGNCAFPQNVRTRKLRAITVFFTVVCTCISLNVLVSHPYVTCMCSYIILVHANAIYMSLLFTLMSWYYTHMYRNVIHTSLVCTRLSSVSHFCVLACHPYSTCMSSVCHSYVLVCYPYVTRV